MMNTYDLFKNFCATLAISLLAIAVSAQSIGICMGFDHWGNKYQWSETELKKIDAVQGLSYRNGNLSYGKISKLDWVQPQKPFAYFEETQRIVFLDNTLSEQGEYISLQAILPSSWITQVSGSVLGGFWCFDHLNLRLIKLDQRGNLLFSLDNLPHFNLLTDWDALGMVEHKNALYLWDHQNLFVFDLLGALTQQLSCPGAQFLFDNGAIFLFDQSQLSQIFPEQKKYSQPIPTAPFCISKNMIFVWNSNIAPIPLE